MARKRMIDPAFWDDLNVAKLSIPARLCFIGMMSNADDEGRIEADPRYIKRAVFGFDDDLSSSDVAAMLGEIQASCPSVTFYHIEGRALAAFSNWLRYQYIQKPHPSKLPSPPVTYEYDTDTIPVSPSRVEENRVEENRKERSAPAPDPLLDEPSIVAYRDAFKLTPNPQQRKVIAETVTDLARWQAKLDRWQTNGYSPKNLTGLLDSYTTPDQPNGRATRANGKTTAHAEAPTQTLEEMRAYGRAAIAAQIAAGELPEDYVIEF